MSLTQRPFTTPDDPSSTLTLRDVAQRTMALRCGERLVLTGTTRDGIADALRGETALARSVLLLAAGPLRTAETIIQDLLDDLAAVALREWPYWYGLAGTRGGPRERADADPRVSRPWLKAASKRAEAGQIPRFPRSARALELGQLLRAIDSSGVILIAEIDPNSPGQAAAMIDALEWCRSLDAAIVAVFATAPPPTPPYDRMLYGARAVAQRDEPVGTRFIAPRSRAHRASVIEQRVEAALREDAELESLFSCNERVPIGGWGGAARVDLLCRRYRIVVELDGPEHRAAPRFADDRHRDYELLVAGYVVLRITNDQVEADLHRAIEKIRAVVRLRRDEEGR